jgi:MinD-like ATPase involved in chromosome partitioning or flagellar assembly
VEDSRMQVSFWSNYHQVGTTYNMIAVSIMIALEYKMRVLLAHNHFDKSTLEHAFIEKKYIRHELTDLSDTGIDALSRAVKFNKLEKDDISNYTTTALKNRLDLLVGTRNTNRDIYINNIKGSINMILQSAGGFYDLVFVDTAPGMNEISMKILEKSDIVVINLNQNIHVIEDYLSNCLGINENLFFILGKYDSDSKFNLKAIKKRFGISDIYTIPYDIGFADACSESRAVDFFIRNAEADKFDVHYPFISGVKETAEAIINRIGIAEKRA